MPTVSADWRASNVATRRLGIDPSPSESRLDAWRSVSACVLATLIAIGVFWRFASRLVAVTMIAPRPWSCGARGAFSTTVEPLAGRATSSACGAGGRGDGVAGALLVVCSCCGVLVDPGTIPPFDDGGGGG